MRIFLVPFAAAALFACANYGASAMSISQADSIKAGDRAVLAWHLAHRPDRPEKADLVR
jgi:hypothetical protein